MEYLAPELYSSDPIVQARQKMIMKEIDTINPYHLVMTRGQNLNSLKNSLKFLEQNMDFEESMVEFYAFPILSRIYFLKNSVLNSIYESLQMENYPRMGQWIQRMRRKYSGKEPELEVLNKDYDRR